MQKQHTACGARPVLRMPGSFRDGEKPIRRARLREEALGWTVFTGDETIAQMVNRRVPTAVPLGALADDASLTLDERYGAALVQQAYLFEYKASGVLFNLDDAEFTAGGGIVICLIKADYADATLATDIAGARIDPDDHGVYETRQALLDVAHWLRFQRVDSTGSGGTNVVDIEWEVHFKPRAKGGIPHFEGVGWKLVIMNRTGGVLTTGAIAHVTRVYERFAYGGF